MGIPDRIFFQGIEEIKRGLLGRGEKWQHLGRAKATKASKQVTAAKEAIIPLGD